ncbi:MAG: inorganic pyrophosphatase [Mucilaginibacter sp.]|nr:inorganic pyrophosphatase [Mucilaginibacter sp.]
MINLLKLPTWADKQHIYAVVETPRGSTCKLDFDSELQAFTLAKPLMAGLAYPYDWGFVPSTKAEDGDPLDVLVIHDAQTYPGVVLRCRPVGSWKSSRKRRARRRSETIESARWVSRTLILCPAQSALQFLPFRLPSLVLALRSLFEGRTLSVDGRRPSVMLSFGFFQGCLRVLDGRSAAFAFFLLGGLFPMALAFTPPFFLVECERGLPRCLAIYCSGRLFLRLRTRLARFAVDFDIGQVCRQVGMFPEGAV